VLQQLGRCGCRIEGIEREPVFERHTTKKAKAQAQAQGYVRREGVGRIIVCCLCRIWGIKEGRVLCGDGRGGRSATYCWWWI
jgi:hypothetical protein